MTRPVIALIFTVVYWLASLPLASVLSPAGWFTLTWIGVVLLFVLPITVLLWILVLALRVAARNWREQQPFPPEVCTLLPKSAFAGSTT
jgi:hypothetical protein